MTTAARPARLRRAAGIGLGGGLGTLLPVGRLPRRATAGVVGVLTGGLVAAGAALPGPPEERAPAPMRARMVTSLAVGALVGGASAGSVWLGLAVDGAAERWLRRRGVARPRVVMAVVAALVGGLAEYADTEADAGAGAAPAGHRPSASRPT